MLWLVRMRKLKTLATFCIAYLTCWWTKHNFYKIIEENTNTQYYQLTNIILMLPQPLLYCVKENMSLQNKSRHKNTSHTHAHTHTYIHLNELNTLKTQTKLTCATLYIWTYTFKRLRAKIFLVSYSFSF